MFPQIAADAILHENAVQDLPPFTWEKEWGLERLILFLLLST